MTTPERLPATIDVDEMRRREEQRRADIDAAHKLLTGPAPSWADPDAFRDAILGVRTVYPDASVLRAEGVVQAIQAYAEGRRRRPHPKDRSAAAIAVRTYARELRWAQAGRTVRWLAVVLFVASFALGFLMGFADCL